MPWKVSPVSDLRLVFVHQVLTLKRPLSDVCREHGISRKTGYKWLRRFQKQPDQPLVDRSRRPQKSPRRTAEQLADRILQVRQQFGWGARKIRAYLRDQGCDMPSVQTVHAALVRRGQVPRAAQPELPPLHFERSTPHQLWQCDHKGPLEVERRKIHPFTVLDDHSRYLVALRPCTDTTVAAAFAVLWEAFAECGLPEAILCDNAFGTTHESPRTLSWFDCQLIRLGIRPIHGRPYHPQTQGKVERLHGTLERELWPSIRRDSLAHFAADLQQWRVQVYNTLRPHEALGDRPPITRFRISPRRRPDKIPDVEYPAGAVLRKVDALGAIRWRGSRIRAGLGLAGQFVRIEQRDHEVALFFAQHEIRCLASDSLVTDNVL